RNWGRSTRTAPSSGMARCRQEGDCPKANSPNGWEGNAFGSTAGRNPVCKARRHIVFYGKGKLPCKEKQGGLPMIVGVPKEIMNREYRVALTPAGARMLAARGHEVLVEAGAGAGSGFSDAEYEAAGARIVPSAERVWGEARLVLKVKEPQPEEYRFFRRGQI